LEQAEKFKPQIHFVASLVDVVLSLIRMYRTIAIDKLEIVQYDRIMESLSDARYSKAGRNLRHLIGMHDIRREQFAGMIGISPTALSSLLRGKSSPRLRTAVNAARAFGITLDDLHADTARCLRAGAGWPQASCRPPRTAPPSSEPGGRERPWRLHATERKQARLAAPAGPVFCGARVVV
jgi:transcriptional regulator with XRE-family HTH domain